MERLLADNQSQMNEMMTSWEEKLEEARKEWEADLDKQDDRTKVQPYFQVKFCVNLEEI